MLGRQVEQRLADSSGHTGLDLGALPNASYLILVDDPAGIQRTTFIKK